MADLFTLVGKISINSAEASKELGAVEKSARSAESAMGDTEKKAGGLASTLGSMAKTAGGVAGGIIITQGLDKVKDAFLGTIGVAADFEKSIDAVGAVANATEDEMKLLSDAALRIGKDTAFSATEASSAMEMLAANGVSVTDIVNGAADATVALAAAGGTDLKTAADTASTAMSVWGIKTSEMGEVVNRLAGAANVSRFGVEDMSAAVAMGGGAAASAGIEFGDFATAIAAMAPSFSSGSDAGTSFKQFLNGLTPTTDKAKDVMKELGLMTKEGSNQFFDAQGNIKSMAEISGLLERATKDLTEEQKAQALETIFGSDAMRAAAALSQVTTEKFKEMDDVMKNTDAAEVAAKRMGNFKGAMDALSGTIETIRINIGMKLIPILTTLALFLAENLPVAIDAISKAFGFLSDALSPLVEQLTKAFEFFTGSEELMIGLGVAIATVLIPTIIAVTAAFIGWTIAMAAAAVAMIIAMAPIILIIAGITLLVAAIIYLIKHWDEVKAKTKEVWEEIKSFLEGVWNGIKAFAEKTWQAIEDWFEEAWNNIKETTSKIWDDIKSFLSDTWNDIKQAATNAWNSLKEAISNILTSIVQAVETEVNKMKDRIENGFNDAIQAIRNLAGDAASAAADFANGIVDRISSIIEGIPATVVGMANSVIRIINNLLNSLSGKVLVPAISDPTGVTGISTPEVRIPSLGQIGYIGYEHGTSYVPEDGLAYLHQGEMVIPADENPMNGGSGFVFENYGPINTYEAPQVAARNLTYSLVSAMQQRGAGMG